MKPHQQPPTNGELRRSDFALIGRASETGAMGFVERLPVEAGMRVLDVGCGTGNCAIAAARRGGDVTGVDGREPHLSRARAWASNEGLKLRFKQADYERLPFSDCGFHLTLSFKGLLFTPHPGQALAQVRRVTRPAGMIAFTAWCPDGFMGRMLALAAHHTRDAGFARALAWGDHEELTARLEPGFQLISIECHSLSLRFPWSPGDVADCYLSYYTPLTRTLATLDDFARRRLRQALSNLWASANTVKHGGTAVDASYWEVLAKRA